MKDIEEVHAALIKYKDMMLFDGNKEFHSSHAHGFCNGIEAALAIIEERPVFFVDYAKNYDPHDVTKHPEHFI